MKQFLLGAALLVGASAALDDASVADAAHATIREHLAEREANAPSADEHDSCTITSEEDCALHSMTTERSTLVYPGGASRCIAERSPFAFMVTPGADLSKLLIYFQGGGACWDKVTTQVGALCSQTLWMPTPFGIFDQGNENNPFADHTVVNILYCSGDAHVANNKTQPWGTFFDPRTPAVQTGQQNVMATLDWIRAQGLGSAALPLESLVISGESAGSLGAQAWAPALLDLFPAKRRIVMPDSYLAVFPEGAPQERARESRRVVTAAGLLGSGLANR